MCTVLVGRQLELVIEWLVKLDLSDLTCWFE
nr:MAG TPA: hypothetical protein [Caudoviricetes sp.]